MLATVLIFLLGVLVASLVALLFTPLLWRKAQGFARREFEATMPATANEIRAEFDAVRAAAALEMRRQEVATVEMRERMGGAQAELGRANVEIAALKKRAREMEAEMAVFAAERDNFREIFAAHRDKERALAETLDEAKRDGSLNAEELEALAGKFREVSELAEGRQIELVAAQTKIERLTDTLRSVERASGEKDTLIRLLRKEGERPVEEPPARAAKSKAGLMPGMKTRAREITASTALPTAAASAMDTVALPPVVPDGARLRDALASARASDELTPAEAAEVRERIADVAANVLYRAALAEGPDSPLGALLHPATDDQARPDGPLRLADRVRRLAASYPRSPATETEAAARAE